MATTDINVKALTKLGKALAGLADAVEILDTFDNIKARLESEVSAKKKELADVNSAVVKAQAAEDAALKAAVKHAEDARIDAEQIMVKADLDSQELIKKSSEVYGKIKSTVAAGEQRLKDIDAAIAARNEQVAALAKQEADILARIADHKAKLIKALE